MSLTFSHDSSQFTTVFSLSIFQSPWATSLTFYFVFVCFETGPHADFKPAVLVDKIELPNSYPNSSSERMVIRKWAHRKKKK